MTTKILPTITAAAAGLLLLAITVAAVLTAGAEVDYVTGIPGAGLPFQVAFGCAGVAAALLAFYVAYSFATTWSTDKVLRAVDITAWFALACGVVAAAWFQLHTHWGADFRILLALLCTVIAAATIHWARQRVTPQLKS
ncbi:hypothetical protein ACUY3K_01360 [Corynebacterium uberis]|uniref:hypothetical protein n=1 Tax=Corynebacterium TaxID=1716 RepID=UPI001D0A1BEA|nr:MULTISPECIES: hypothetical protein [Corynebacterium]MCZ9308918.1 hypothetical protein [Corynebacterium sp. c6VSa_13]UDL74609.1 hypothetical protein LH391_05305 [Corynebacterium uberis]UDL76557.1 hypothetical protein LH393_04090 [Corynebacterium uberis]UDL78770.1 hypothetical protein LH394_04080 [Corynebacterium uberis]UDL81048.1 hypothetical protein LH392_04500 [Corynebacterium uberis]